MCPENLIKGDKLYTYNLSSVSCIFLLKTLRTEINKIDTYYIL